MADSNPPPIFPSSLPRRLKLREHISANDFFLVFQPLWQWNGRGAQRIPPPTFSPHGCARKPVLSAPQCFPSFLLVLPFSPVYPGERARVRDTTRTFFSPLFPLPSFPFLAGRNKLFRDKLREFSSSLSFSEFFFMLLSCDPFNRCPDFALFLPSLFPLPPLFSIYGGTQLEDEDPRFLKKPFFFFFPFYSVLLSPTRCS